MQLEPTRSWPIMLSQHLNRTGVPLHQQLYLVLRDQILRGLYSPGDRIPNETQLEELFGVSRITVRRAVKGLEAENLVEKRRGIGTMVRNDLPPLRPAATLGFLDSLRKQAINTEVTVVDLERTLPPAVISLQLELPASELAVHAIRVRSSNGVPLLVTSAWIPDPLAEHVTREALTESPLYEILLKGGIKFERVVQEITAVPADPWLSALLRVGVGEPLLKMTRLLYAKARKPIQHLTIYISPEHSRILMDVGIENINTLGAGQIAHNSGFLST